MFSLRARCLARSNRSIGLNIADLLVGWGSIVVADEREPSSLFESFTASIAGPASSGDGGIAVLLPV